MIGRTVWNNGEVYDGNYLMGIREGQGTLAQITKNDFNIKLIGKMIFANGDVYEGNY